MKIFIFILSFIAIYSQQLNLLKIDLVLNSDNFYTIKNIDSNLNFSYTNNSNICLMPKKYLNLIKMILKNNKVIYNCNTYKLLLENKEFETFYCEKNMGKNDIIKLKFNFEKYNISLNESQLFLREKNFYYFNFWTNDNISDITLSKIINLNNNKINMRKLESEDENENENNNITNRNNTNKNSNNSKKKKSRFGLLGVFLIIILSLVIIYVLFVGFRYYRRKKYQNPSFYYKITEEMFDDITPIE